MRGWITWSVTALALSVSGQVAEASPLMERPCSSAMRADMSPPVRVDRNNDPIFPGSGREASIEGWVHLVMTIDPDGRVAEITTVDAIGAKTFHDNAVKAVKGRRYTPAMRDGKAVAIYGSQTVVTYEFEKVKAREAWHPDLASAYEQALDSIREGKFKSAIGVIKKALKVRGNHYEQSMLSVLLARAYNELDEYDEALFHMRHANIQDSRFLEASITRPALRMELELEAELGHYREAACTYEHLLELKAPASDHPDEAKNEAQVGETMSKIRAAVADAKPLTAKARLVALPFDDDVGSWRHTLLRPNFSFADVKGDAGRFHLRCISAELKGEIGSAASWRIPAPGESCTIFVYGAPGATFSFSESD